LNAANALIVASQPAAVGTLHLLSIVLSVVAAGVLSKI
jgi:hypothetical protein